MTIWIVLDHICDAFLAACESQEGAESYIMNTGIRHFGKIREIEIEVDELKNDKLFVVTRAKNGQFVYCSGNSIPRIANEDYVVKEYCLLRSIKAPVNFDRSGTYVFNPEREYTPRWSRHNQRN